MIENNSFSSIQKSVLVTFPLLRKRLEDLEKTPAVSLVAKAKEVLNKY